MTTLDTLLTTHRQTIQNLLGTLPLSIWKVEQYGPLTKYIIGQMGDSRWAMLHHLTAPDEGDPHDHPARFESHGIVGSYSEQVFAGGSWSFKLWGPGSSHTIEADCVHRITQLYDDDVWTLCFAGPVVREWRHYSLQELVA